MSFCLNFFFLFTSIDNHYKIIMRTTSLFLTLAYVASMVMARPTIRAEPAESHVSYSSCNRPGVFALTFDDGPDKYSWGLAKTLHDQGIKATFFINGANSV